MRSLHSSSCRLETALIRTTWHNVRLALDFQKGRRRSLYLVAQSLIRQYLEKEVEVKDLQDGSDKVIPRMRQLYEDLVSSKKDHANPLRRRLVFSGKEA